MKTTPAEKIVGFALRIVIRISEHLDQVWKERFHAILPQGLWEAYFAYITEE